MMQMNETGSRNTASTSKSTSEASAKLADCGLFIKQLEDFINQHIIYSVQRSLIREKQRL